MAQKFLKTALLTLLITADAYAVDVTVLPDHGTPATTSDSVLAYDQSAASGSRLTEIKFSANSGQCLTGTGTWVSYEPSLTANAVAGSEIDTVVMSKIWNASDLVTDGTVCTIAAGSAINSGPLAYEVSCSAWTDGAIYGNITMPDSWNGGTVVFGFTGVNKNAAPSGTQVLTFAAQCRTPGTDTINNTWGTGVGATATYDTQFVPEFATTTAVTPDGSTCAGGDVVFWKATLTGTSTQYTDIDLLDVKMEWTSNVGD